MAENGGKGGMDAGPARAVVTLAKKPALRDTAPAPSGTRMRHEGEHMGNCSK